MTLPPTIPCLSTLPCFLAITLPEWQAWCAAHAGRGARGEGGEGDEGVDARGAGADAQRCDADAAARLAQRALIRCAHWCMRWTPRVHIETQNGPPAVVLDLTGCLPANGGLGRVRRRIARGLDRRGVAHELGAASTAGGALALSMAAVAQGAAHMGRGAPAVHAAPATHAASAAPASLSAIPVHALRLDPALVEGLHELHIRTVGQLLVIDRSAIADRFGPMISERLDALTGDRPWAFNAVPAPDRARAEFVFASPCAQLDAVQCAMQQAVGLLCDELARRVRSVSVLQVFVQRARMPPVRGVLYFGVPTRSATHLCSLLAPRVERMQLGCHEHGMGIERIELTALRVGSAHADAAHQAVGQLVDQLAARLGEGCVRAVGCEPHGAVHRGQRAT